VFAVKNWRFHLVLLLLLTPILGFSFTIVVTSTSESCTGNGTLNFNAVNADPSGTIVYEIYLLPNTSVPLATVTTNNLTGLSAGNYRVIAKETVGTAVSTQQQDITIINTAVPLEFVVQSFNQACSSNSNITIQTTSGTGVSYEIFSGPVTFPLQASNTFSGLPVGVYRIRVFDACGTGVVSTFTVTLNPTGLSVGPTIFSNTTPPSCSFTVVNHLITPAAGTVIGYPLTLNYVVHPPGGGAAISINNTLTSGNLTSQNTSATIPYYLNQNYDYDLTITDACGSVFTNNFIVNQNITLTAAVFPLSCNTNYFNLNTTNFTPPFTLQFLSTPAGFNPVTFNSTYPGPFMNGTVAFGDQANTVPLGVYQVMITDFCGRTTTSTFTIFSIPPAPSATATNNGCSTNSGKIVVSILNFKIVTATITAAPTSYPFPLPHDVTGSIDAFGVLTLDPVPLGDYTIQLTDECSDPLSPLLTTVPIYVDQGLAFDLRPGCELTKSSLKLSSNNAALSAVTITAAPISFGQTLPLNASANITADGSCYLSGLPDGSYTFNCVDVCNFSNTITVNVVGYAITNSSFSLQANCGSFDIPLNFISNGIINQSFWLQKLIDTTSNTWGNPTSGAIYPEGTVPNATNSYFLNNGGTNFNLVFNGTFRIVRAFTSYNNGIDFNTNQVTSTDKDCLEILSPTLSFNQVLEIIDAYRMPCSASGNLDVVVKANGTLPLHYTITEKDGIPFFFNNGTSNTFQNLAAGIYNIQVQDNCGNIVNRVFDVSTLLSLVIATPPNDIVTCLDTITGNETYDLTVQNAVILGTQSPANYTLTYHQTLADAQGNLNAINQSIPFNPSTNPQTIYARLVYNPLPNCYEITSFDLVAGQIPKLQLQANYVSCSAAPITIDAGVNNLPSTTYVWSDGSTTPAITVTQLGVNHLTVTATNTYGANNQACTNTKDIVVTLSENPVIQSIETQDWTYDQNSITVITSNSGAFEYSLDNSTFQDQNTFTNLEPGVYTVFVRDKYGCSMVQQDVWLLYYPNFFTPNNDSYNDTWQIPNAPLEPNLTVFIYDRYGKFIHELGSKSVGWDGTYNGQQAVSNDYWFVVNRQDGRILKGHFTLKR